MLNILRLQYLVLRQVHLPVTFMHWQQGSLGASTWVFKLGYIFKSPILLRKRFLKIIFSIFEVKSILFEFSYPINFWTEKSFLFNYLFILRLLITALILVYGKKKTEENDFFSFQFISMPIILTSWKMEWKLK